MLWKGLTTRGAFIGGFVGLIGAVALTILSPGIWEAVFGYPKGSALFPYTSPAIFTMPLAFFCCWLFSITDNVGGRGAGAGGVRGPIRALADRHRRGRGGRALTPQRE